MRVNPKPHLNLLMCGHVDHGKSTIMGHFLYEMGVVDQKTVDDYAKESEKTGMGDTFKFAWVLDKLKEERERGMTIDLAKQKFETEKYYYTLIDAPGHRDFIKNMITGASQADCALLVCSAKAGETEAGISPGGQTREHTFLCKTLGVNQIVVIVNKMDDATVEWSQARFEQVTTQLRTLLTTAGFDVGKTQFIPASGWKGDNLTRKSERMPWYAGSTLVEALDMVEEPAKPVDKPLRIPIQNVYSITGVGTVPVGRIETGRMKAGDAVVIMPEGVTTDVRSIEQHHVRLEKAEAGDNVGFNLKGVSKQEIHRGSVAGDVKNPPTVAKEFIGQIIVIYHPTQLTAGYSPVLHAHTAQVRALVPELLFKVDPRTGQITEEKPKALMTGESATIRVQLRQPLCIEEFKTFPELGRFVLRDMGMTIAAGVVKEITQTWTTTKPS
ncbi:MAG: translation elongation factor EF-1 subunit alpha [Candidatus Bathyarchaeia archaeon]